MKLLFTTASFLLITVVAVSIHQGAFAEMIADKPNIPKTVGAWSRPDTPQVIDSTNIFAYMCISLHVV